MSAGVFSNTLYAASYDAAEIHPIRVQPETIAASAAGTLGAVVNNPPPGTATSPISAIVTGSARGLGLRARLISLKLTGTPPTGYVQGSTVRIPALTEAFFSACTKGTAVTYLETAWEAVGRRSESAK